MHPWNKGGNTGWELNSRFTYIFVEKSQLWIVFSRWEMNGLFTHSKFSALGSKAQLSALNSNSENCWYSSRMLKRILRTTSLVYKSDSNSMYSIGYSMYLSRQLFLFLLIQLSNSLLWSLSWTGKHLLYLEQTKLYL